MISWYQFSLYLTYLYYDKFEHFILIPCILHYLSVLKFIQKYQVIRSLQISVIVHGWFIDIGNSLENIMHYLPICGITYLGHGDEFSMVIVFMCMVAHWIELTKSHMTSDYQIAMTTSSYYVIWVLNLERILH